MLCTATGFLKRHVGRHVFKIAWSSVFVTHLNLLLRNVTHGIHVLDHPAVWQKTNLSVLVDNVDRAANALGMAPRRFPTAGSACELHVDGASFDDVRVVVVVVVVSATADDTHADEKDDEEHEADATSSGSDGQDGQGAGGGWCCECRRSCGG